MDSRAHDTYHRGFIRTSGVFIALNFLSSLLEIGFNFVVARLPDGGYGIYGRLFSVFFIITIPFVSIQLMVSKEVSSFLATGKQGKAVTFVRRSLLYVTGMGAILALSGVCLSRYIADFLNIGSAVPVILLMLMIACYSPYPVLIGTVQGLKQFYTIGFIAIFWGFFRFTTGAVAFWALGWRLNGILAGVILAVILTVAHTWVKARRMVISPVEGLRRDEFGKAFSLVVPIAFTLFAVTVMRSIDLVIARRFFSFADVDAYTCAAKVGQAFFMLTSIILVMFPSVSEQRSLNRNPNVYLVKSLFFTVGLTLGGIVVSLAAPGLVMKVITVGGNIPGSEPLIQMVGLVVLPVSVIYIVANYLLAQHKTAFIPVLALGMIGQIILIAVFHTTPLTMLRVVGTANAITMVFMLAALAFDMRKSGGEPAVAGPDEIAP